MKEKVFYTASTEWIPYKRIKNPDRKWYQFWKPRYIWIPDR